MNATYLTIPSELNAACQFPDQDWSDDYRKLIKPLNNYLPFDWEHGLKLPPIPAVGTEKIGLKAHILADREEHAEAIYSQAINFMRSIQPVLAVFGNLHLPSPKIQTICLLQTLWDSLMAPLFQLKSRFNRGRPWHEYADSQFEQMAGFRQTDLGPEPFYPGHPAFPSGHATVAHAVALVLAEIKPDLHAKLIKAAAGVATNREIAGLHFPSDSRAGEALAAHLVKKLLQANTGFAQLLIAAKTEWS